MKAFKIDAISFVGAVFLTIISAYVFYDKVYGIIPASVVGVYGYRMILVSRRDRIRLRKLTELRSVMVSVQTALEAGKSMQNAFLSAASDMTELYGKKNLMVDALKNMQKKLELNYTFDQAVREFAKEIDIDEAYEFADIISTIRKTGGNAVRIIKDSVERIISEMELREELSTIVAAKKLEMMIMVAMPAIITLFLRFTSKGYLDPLYTTPAGVLIMTVMMMGNIGACHIGRKIISF